MPFFGIDDNFAMHPKVIAAGNAAIGAWARMGSHCVNHGLDGFISEKETRIFATPGQIKRLLECSVTEEGVGLLEQGEQNGVKGYIFHDWTQPDVETIRRRREVRAAAGRKGGRASAASRAARTAPSSKYSVQANASPYASPYAQPNTEPYAQPNGKQTSSTEDIGLGLVGSPVSTQPYETDMPARAAEDSAFDLATSERNDLSPPVSVGASRLVATVIRNGVIPDADRTILRIKTSAGLSQGRSDDDMAECLRIWLTKSELGPNALLCCLTEVDKRKLNSNGHRLATSDLRVLEGEALKQKFRTHDPIGELPSAR